MYVSLQAAPPSIIITMPNKNDTFAQLQTKMRACRKCKEAGHWIEPPAVTQGLVTAQMMTIGQAPGITEVEAQRPFNAGSGTPQ